MQVFSYRLLVCFGLLFLLMGCVRLPEPPVHDESLLDRMAEIRSQSSGHALLISQSGLMACLPYNNESSQAELLPVDGLYHGSLRVLQGWEWNIEGIAGKAVGTLASSDIIRPDRIERIVAPGIYERIILVHDQPVCLLELYNPLPGTVAELELHFDLRPVRLDFADYSSRYDPSKKLLILGNPLYGYVAVACKGDWFDVPRRERVEFHKMYPPLDNVATVTIPGSWKFGKGERILVSIAAGGSEKIATTLALEAFKDADNVRFKTEQYVMDFLNRAPIVCDDKHLEAALAWDRWLLFNHRVTIADVDCFLPAPPLGIESDAVVDARAMPAWFWATGGDNSVETILDSALAVAGDTLPDPEGAIFALTGWADWIDLTGCRHSLESRLDLFAEAFHSLGRFAKANNKTIVLHDPSRWELKLKSANLLAQFNPSRAGLSSIFSALIDRAVLWDQYAIDWKNIFGKTASRTLYRGVRIRHPYNSIIKNDPYVWSEKERTAWQEAKDNPDFNLGYVEYVLYSDRDSRSRQHLGRIVSDHWASPRGYRWRFDKMYEQVSFTSSKWLIRAAMIRERGFAVPEDFEMFTYPQYAVWYKSDQTDTLTATVLPGEGPESTETIAERIRFFHEVILGLKLNPEDRIFSLAPIAPVNIWNGRAVTMTLNIGGEIISLQLDPYKGLYLFVRPGGEDELTVNLRDVPKGSTQLSVRTKLKRRGVTEIRRGIGKSGEPTLLVDGIEIIFTEKTEKKETR